MKESDLEKLKDAWKKKDLSETSAKELNAEKINSFISGKSKSLSASFRNGLLFDIVLKSILVGTLIILVILSNMVDSILFPAISVGVTTFILLLMQVLVFVRMPHIDLGESDLKQILGTELSYYRKKYKLSLFITAASSTLFFITGSLYYFFFKYGGVRRFDIDDMLVFGIAVIFSYVISYAAQSWNFNFGMDQLQKCFDEIDQENFEEIEAGMKKQKLRKNITMLLLLASGMTLLTIFLFAMYYL